MQGRNSVPASVSAGFEGKINYIYCEKVRLMMGEAIIISRFVKDEE